MESIDLRVGTGIGIMNPRLRPLSGAPLTSMVNDGGSLPRAATGTRLIEGFNGPRIMPWDQEPGRAGPLGRPVWERRAQRSRPTLPTGRFIVSSGLEAATGKGLESSITTGSQEGKPTRRPSHPLNLLHRGSTEPGFTVSPKPHSATAAGQVGRTKVLYTTRKDRLANLFALGQGDAMSPNWLRSTQPAASLPART
jgi:hypothetical protein